MDNQNSSKEIEKKEKKNKNKKDKKDKPEVKKSALATFFKTEYRWESYFTGFVSAISIGIGALMLTKAISFSGFMNDYQTFIGWFFIVAGIFGLLLFLIPVFKPTRKEIKQLTWPTKKLFFGNVVRVFIFVTILALVLLLYEFVISSIIGFIV